MSVYKLILRIDRKHLFLLLFYNYLCLALQVMKDTQLYLVIGIMVGVDLVVMTAWQIFDPFYRETKKLAPYVSFLLM